MSKNTSVILNDHFDSFVEKKLEEGRYGSVSELVRTGLRLLEDEELKLEAVRKIITASKKSGTSNYSYEELMAEIDREKS